MLAFADAKCYTTAHQQLFRDRSRIHVTCCRIQFGDSSILMAMRAFRVVAGHRQIGESLWTSVTLPELKRNQLGIKVQHSWLNSILLKQWGSNAYISSLLLGQSDGLQSSLSFVWGFILSSLLLGQSDGLQSNLPLCWGFIIYSMLLGQSEGIQASLFDLVGFILSANLLGRPVGISASLPGFVGFYRIGYTDINI